MSLDACVYCDCLERNLIRTPLPKDVSIKVEDDGYPIVVKNGQEIWEDHPDWNDFACEHQDRRLLHHRLGNISSIGLLRTELSRVASSFPIILEKVIYNGTHAGDWLALAQIPDLRIELHRLAEFNCTTSKEADVLMQEFRIQMNELVEAALKVGKPISF
jgi:hypothetical protein